MGWLFNQNPNIMQAIPNIMQAATLPKTVKISSELCGADEKNTVRNQKRKRKRKSYYEGIPVRRSERIKAALQTKQRLEESTVTTALTTVRRKKTSKTISRSSTNVGVAIDSEQQNRAVHIAEETPEIIGTANRNGKKFILVKWPNIAAIEYIEESLCTAAIKNLVIKYHEEHLAALRTSSSEVPTEVIKDETTVSNVLQYRTKQMLVMASILREHISNNILHVKVE